MELDQRGRGNGIEGGLEGEGDRDGEIEDIFNYGIPIALQRNTSRLSEV